MENMFVKNIKNFNKMTYYYLKQKVSLGDIIDFKGLKVEVTNNLIRSNPDLFVVEEELLPEYWECTDDGMGNEFTFSKIYKIQDRTDLEEWSNFIDDAGERNGFSPRNHKHFKPSTKEAFDRQELLEEAKRRYPVGTRFKSAAPWSSSEFYIVKGDPINWQNTSYPDGVGNTDFGMLYANGKWAEIIKPIFKTEDGIDVYEGDTIYYVRKDFKGSSNEIIEYRNYQGLYSGLNIYFSTKEAAEDWLSKNKPKDLQYYEDLLWDDNLSSGSVDNLIKHSDMYVCLKLTNPKLYWLKVLELIQQDLDEGWKADLVGSHPNKWFIHSFRGKIGIDATDVLNRGQQMFKTRESAQKAIELMKDKLDIIFK